MFRRFRPFSFIVSRLLTRAISNLALQSIEKVPDMSRNSARCMPTCFLHRAKYAELQICKDKTLGSLN